MDYIPPFIKCNLKWKKWRHKDYVAKNFLYCKCYQVASTFEPTNGIKLVCWQHNLETDHDAHGSFEMAFKSCFHINWVSNLLE